MLLIQMLIICEYLKRHKLRGEKMKDPENLENYPEKSLKNPERKCCRNSDPLARKSRHKKRGTHKNLMKTHLRSRKTHQEYVIRKNFRPRKLGFRKKTALAEKKL